MKRLCHSAENWSGGHEGTLLQKVDAHPKLPYNKRAVRVALVGAVANVQPIGMGF